MIEADLRVCPCRSHFFTFKSVTLVSSDKGRTAGDLGSNAVLTDGISDVTGHLPGVGNAVAVAVAVQSISSVMVSVEERRRRVLVLVQLCSIANLSLIRLEEETPISTPSPPRSYSTAPMRISYPAPYTPIEASPPPPSPPTTTNQDPSQTKQADTDLYIPLHLPYTEPNPPPPSPPPSKPKPHLSPLTAPGQPSHLIPIIMHTRIT